MNDFLLRIDLHKSSDRQGPGGETQTKLALALSGLSARSNLTIADLGCGTGASTLVLARELDAQITAADFQSDFLEILEEKAAREGLGDKIETLAVSMDALPFADASYDAIWAESAIYNIGFENGIRIWRPFLKENGILVVSELTWPTHARPTRLQRHWDSEYPEVAHPSRKMDQLKECGYSLIGYFPFPINCWLTNYYRPMQERFSDFPDRHAYSKEAKAIVAAEGVGIDLYEHFLDMVGYGFFIARKIS